MEEVEAPFGDMLIHFAEMEAHEWIWPMVETCSRIGVFHSDPNRCILARPVNHKIPIDVLNALGDVTPEHPDFEKYRELTSTPDTWHIIYASGDIRSFFELATVELEYVLWQRDGREKAKLYDLNKIKSRVYEFCKTKDAVSPSTS